MKKLLQKLFAWIKWLYISLDHVLKENISIAIGIVEGIKKGMDSNVDDVLIEIAKAVFPGKIDNVIIDKVYGLLENWLPKVLVELKMIEAVIDVDDPMERLKLTLHELTEQLKFASEDTRKAFYHNLASLAAEKLSDNKLTWSESVMLVEYAYNYKYKKQLK